MDHPTRDVSEDLLTAVQALAESGRLVASMTSIMLLRSHLRASKGISDEQFLELLRSSIEDYGALMLSIEASDPSRPSSQRDDDEDDEGRDLRSLALTAAEISALNLEEAAALDAEQAFTQDEEQDVAHPLNAEKPEKEFQEGISPKKRKILGLIKRLRASKSRNSRPDDGDDGIISEPIGPSEAMVRDALAANSIDGAVNVGALVAALSSQMSVPNGQKPMKIDQANQAKKNIALDAVHDTEINPDENHRGGQKI